MRQGELLGLKWSDIDFEKETLSIQRSVLYLPKKGVFADGTKTFSSVRVLKVSDTVLHPLKRLKASQAEERLLLGDAWHNEDWIFTTYDGHVMRPDYLTRWFNQFLKRKELPDIHLHSLRHTNASTTTKIYSHAIQSAEAAAVEALDNLLDKRCQNIE